MKDYKSIWNDLSTSFADASYHVCCVGDEDEIRENGARTAQFLRSVMRIEPHERVLEIGCGVARIGRELSPYCREWHGADISGNMIVHARERTADVPNIVLHELPDNSLRIFADNSFDCVYCTIVFMHLDKPDVFNYIRDARRVLKPGGRAYFDTYNLLAPEAWQQFLKITELYPAGQRVGHVSQFSTPQELRKFMEEARYDVIVIDDQDAQLVLAFGEKHADPSFVEDPDRSVLAPAEPVPKPADLTKKAVTPEEQEAYLRFLETEIERKNAAIVSLEARIRQYGAALDAARRPRLPWKRLKSGGRPQR